MTVTTHPIDERVSDLPAGLSKPAQRALAGAGYVRLEQFTTLHEVDLLRLHGMGPKALDLIRRALLATGRSFADGPPKNALTDRSA